MGLGSTLQTINTIPGYVDAYIAQSIRAMQEEQHDLIIIASISATVDHDDVIPSAICRAEGSVAHFGVPVDPDSLLVLGYIGQTPVFGAPGCVKPLQTNVINLILPRLLAGERLTHTDLVAMGTAAYWKTLANA